MNDTIMIRMYPDFVNPVRHQLQRIGRPVSDADVFTEGYTQARIVNRLRDRLRQYQSPAGLILIGYNPKQEGALRTHGLSIIDEVQHTLPSYRTSHVVLFTSLHEKGDAMRDCAHYNCARQNTFHFISEADVNDPSRLWWMLGIFSQMQKRGEAQSVRPRVSP